MDYPTPAVPGAGPAARSRDPLAVALANASLLSAGYLVLGRRRLAALTALVTVVLVILLGTTARSGGFEVAVLVWWAALVTHGWFLAGGRIRRPAVRGTRPGEPRGPVVMRWLGRVRGEGPARGQRLAALGIALPVLLVAGLLRLDASSIEGSVADARHSGDCAKALTAQHRVWFGPRAANPPLTAGGDRTVQACHRLETAKGELTTGLSGDTEALNAGFATLSSVLADLPGHEKMVDVVLDGFLGALPAKDPCHTAAVTDWLRERPASHDVLDRSAGVVARTAPVALVGCGDDLTAAKNWQKARARYQQLLDQYPGFRLAAKARGGVRKATLAIELANVRSLLEGPSSEAPEYCSKPAKYSGAAPYRKGTNRTMFYGADGYTGKLPASWRTTDAAKAVLVLCAGDKDYGTSVRTCPYDSESKLFSDFPTDVTFHKIAIPVKVYELRTGKLVTRTKVQISGASCPEHVSYTSFDYTDLGPPPDMYVAPSHTDIRAAFKPAITR